MISKWIEAFRLRTLPLALASIVMGGFLALVDHQFNTLIFTLACATTLFLQILSNLANDYGDSVNGVDNSNRVGPLRSVQSGSISRRSMKFAVIVFIALSLISGISLIALSFGNTFNLTAFIFFIMGCGAIAAAIKYTVGRNPYGYVGFGDFFVFLFFGLVGVCGSYFLMVHEFQILIILPAAAVGLLSSAVLNLNNLRDHVNDKASGKITLVVKFGFKNGKIYHWFLLFIPFLLLIAYATIHFRTVWNFMFLAALPLQIGNFVRVWKNSEPQLLDIELKRMALLTILVVLLFGIGINI